MSPAEITEAVTAGRLRLIDVAAPPRFAQGHPAGAVNLPFGPGFAQGASTLGRDLRVAVFAEQPAIAARAGAELGRLGLIVDAIYDRGLEAWRADGGTSEGVAQMSVDELAERLRAGQSADLTVLDVREPYEWRSGVIPGAILMSMASVPERAGELDRDRTIAVLCAHGSRSAQVSSWLNQQGFAKVHNVPGGMALWLGAKHPSEPPPR